MDKTIDVRALIAASIEPTEPQDTILRIIREHDGKRLDSRVIKAIRHATGDQDVYDRRENGMTHIEDGTYRRARYSRERPDYGRGCSLLIAHAEKNVVIDAQQIEKYNACYFSALAERNKKRHALLGDAGAIEDAEEAIDDFMLAWHYVLPFIKPSPGGPWSVIEHDLSKAVERAQEAEAKLHRRSK